MSKKNILIMVGVIGVCAAAFLVYKKMKSKPAASSAPASDSFSESLSGKMPVLATAPIKSTSVNSSATQSAKVECPDKPGYYYDPSVQYVNNPCASSVAEV